jgi:hypothetical protein
MRGTDVPIGLCRIKAGWRNQDSVLVRYGDGTVQELPARRYIELKYLPPLEDLPPCPEIPDDA